MSQNIPEGCPMHSKTNPKTEKSTDSTSTETSNSTKESKECPVKPSQRKIYNVYGQLIDPTNQMPANPNQEPRPGQRIPLPTDRVKSGIPKGGTDDETWSYPSPQMFFNSLRRKGKDDDFKEEDAEMVVAIHNNMNEKTWREVLKWEKYHCEECPNPKLLKFLGRPDELSPKARIKTWFGWVEPFDRHDWYVDRCGKEVRYVIDYYYDEGRAHLDKVPELEEDTGVKSIHLDVRPAIESPINLVERIMRFPDRMKEMVDRYRKGYDFSVKRQTEVAKIKEDEKEFLSNQLKEIHQKCASHYESLAKCTDEKSCQRENAALNFCIGSVACIKETREALGALEKNDEALIDQNLSQMDQCLYNFGAIVNQKLKTSINHNE